MMIFNDILLINFRNAGFYHKRAAFLQIFVKFCVGIACEFKRNRKVFFGSAFGDAYFV